MCWIYVSQFKFTFTFVRACTYKGFYCSFSLYDLICAKMTQIVLAALTDQHLCKISKADWAVVLKLIPQITFLGKKITTFYVFQLIFSLHWDITNFSWFLLNYVLRTLAACVLNNTKLLMVPYFESLPVYSYFLIPILRLYSWL